MAEKLVEKRCLQSFRGFKPKTVFYIKFCDVDQTIFRFKM